MGWRYTGIGRTPESPVTVAQSITHDSRTNRKTSEAVFGNRLGVVVRQMRYQARKIAAGIRITHALFQRAGAGAGSTITAAAAGEAPPVGYHATAKQRSTVAIASHSSSRLVSASSAPRPVATAIRDGSLIAVSTSSHPEPKKSNSTVPSKASAYPTCLRTSA